LPKVDIYTTPFCPFCYAAKKLLARKGVSFTEIDVMMKPAKRREMTERANGASTVPQIFIDGEHLGDCDELLWLDGEGTLDAKLALEA